MFNLQLKTNKAIFSALLAMLVEPAYAVDFETVYQSALKSSAELTKVRTQSDEANANFGASNSNFMPRAGVESRYETFDSDFERVKGGTANAFVEWNVFNGFRDMQNRRSLGAEAKAVRFDKDRFEMNFKWMTMAKYSKAQVLQEHVEAYKRVIQSNQRNLQAVKTRRSSGRLSDADFFEFELFDSKLKQNLIELETEASAAMAELEAFSGVSPIGELTTQLKPKSLALDDLNFREMLGTQASKLHTSQLKLESAEARRALTTGGFLPEVNMKATYGSMGLRDTDVAPETAFAISARWELFSGLETVNSRRVATAQLARAQAEYESDRIQSLSRAEQLRKQLRSIFARLEFEEKNQKNVERFLKTVEQEYRLGVKNSADLKSALELVLDTDLNRASLRSDYFSARAELQEILGIELKEL